MSASASPISGAGGDTFEMVVRVEDGHKDVVALEFNKPVRKVYLPPETARAVGEKFARCAYQAQFGDTPTTQSGSAITDMKISRLRIRVAKMIEGMQGQDPKIQANAIVDAVLTEVA